MPSWSVCSQQNASGRALATQQRVQAIQTPRQESVAQAEDADGRSWYGEPGAGEVVEWEAVLRRAGVGASPARVAHSYLELAVLVRALEGLSASARLSSVPDRSSLWAGLFDLQDTLLGSTVDDLRALAA